MSIRAGFEDLTSMTMNPKHRLTFAVLHCVVSQKLKLFTNYTVMRKTLRISYKDQPVNAV
jgi:hypothetical protein